MQEEDNSPTTVGVIWFNSLWCCPVGNSLLVYTPIIVCHGSDRIKTDSRGVFIHMTIDKPTLCIQRLWVTVWFSNFLVEAMVWARSKHVSIAEEFLIHNTELILLILFNNYLGLLGWEYTWGLHSYHCYHGNDRIKICKRITCLQLVGLIWFNSLAANAAMVMSGQW